MSTYQDLQLQIAHLQAQAEQARQKELTAVVNEIKQKIAAYSLTPEDLGFTLTRRMRTVKKAPLPAKYRNPRTGETWSGRGMSPAWIKDKNKEKYLIQQ